MPLTDTLLQDLRFALRLLRRDRAYAITALLVLGLGIGVNNMLFTILNAHTIRGLPIRGVERAFHSTNQSSAAGLAAQALATARAPFGVPSVAAIWP